MSTDDVIEKAAIALAEADGQSRHDVVWDFDDEGRKTVSEPAWVYYVPSGQALADAGLLARPLPDREEVIDLLKWNFWPFLSQDPVNPERFWGQSADAVLALMKGQDA